MKQSQKERLLRFARKDNTGKCRCEGVIRPKQSRIQLRDFYSGFTLNNVFVIIGRSRDGPTDHLYNARFLG